MMDSWDPTADRRVLESIHSGPYEIPPATACGCVRATGLTFLILPWLA